MKKQRITISALLVVGMLLGMSILYAGTLKLSEHYTDAKAGHNGSFEYHKNGLPANWLVYTANTTGSGKFSIATNDVGAYDGKEYLKIDVNTCSGKPGRFSPGIAQEYAVKAATTYEVSCWIKNNGAKYAININGVSATTASKPIIIQSDQVYKNWTLLKYNYTMPNDMKKLRVELNVLSKGVFCIDNIQVKEVKS